MKDIGYAVSLLNEIGIEYSYPEIVSRIGSIRSSKPRLIRVKCSDLNEKGRILRESRNLRNLPDFQGIFINPDQTVVQRKRGAELRRELKSRREAGEDVRIRHGRVVTLDQDKNFH